MALLRTQLRYGNPQKGQKRFTDVVSPELLPEERIGYLLDTEGHIITDIDGTRIQVPEVEQKQPNG